MNIHEFSERYGIKLAKVRRIAKDHPNWFSNSSTAFDAIRASLANADPLSAAQLVELVESPDALLELGTYAGKAEEALSALGNAKGEAAPKDVTAYIMDAAKGDLEAVAILMQWIKSILPAKPVQHSYIAVRLLLGLAPSIRKFDVPRIPRALLNVRRHPEFEGWWSIRPGVSRNATLYQKPRKTGFDL